VRLTGRTKANALFLSDDRLSDVIAGVKLKDRIEVNDSSRNVT
jgi:hypothetical protein